MKEINRQVLDFFENGVFEDSSYNYKKGEILESERFLFKLGFKRFVSEILEKINREMKEIFGKDYCTDLRIRCTDNQIYLYGEIPGFKIYEFKNLDLTNVIEEISLNSNSIVEKAVEIMTLEIEQFNHNKSLLQKTISKEISKRKEVGGFSCDYGFYNTNALLNAKRFPKDPIVLGQYFPKSCFLRISFLGLIQTLKEERSNEPRLLKDKRYSEDEMQVLAETAADELEMKFKKEPIEHVRNEIRITLKKKYEISQEEISKINFSKEEGSLETDFKSINVPVNVTFEEIKKIVQMISILERFKHLSPSVKKVLENSNSFSKKYSFDSILKDFDSIVKEIEDNLDGLNELIHSNEVDFNFKEFKYGNIFFALKKEQTFIFKGNEFSRINYRYPGSKKTKSLMYENGSRISENRFFRILRKTKKK